MKANSKEMKETAIGIEGIGNLTDGPQPSEENWRKIIQIATGINGIANLRGGEEASEGENSKRN